MAGIDGVCTSMCCRYPVYVDRRAVTAIAALHDGVREALYRYVRAADHPVSRESAANAVGISRKLAAFHLDKLVEAGLLEARREAVGPRRVGRTPKTYRPATTEISVHVPPRSPYLLADILLEAIVAERPGEPAGKAAHRIARARGRAIGVAERERTRPGRLGAERALTHTAALLGRHGYEPGRAPARLRLRNCPFHPLAQAGPDLVCGLNHALLTGVLEGLRADDALTAALIPPREGACCVELRARPSPRK